MKTGEGEKEALLQKGSFSPSPDPTPSPPKTFLFIESLFAAFPVDGGTAL